MKGELRISKGRVFQMAGVS